MKTELFNVVAKDQQLEINKEIYLIRSRTARDDKTDEPLYWNNDMGWGDMRCADIFTHDDSKELNVPIEGEWVQFNELK